MALDMEKILKQKQALDSRINNAKGGNFPTFLWWKASAGENKLRLMPGWADEGEFAGQFWREIAQHWNLSEENKEPVTCVRNTPGMSGDCPACEIVDQLRTMKNDVEAQELLKQIRAKTAYLLNVIDLKNPVYTAQDVAEFKTKKPDADPPFDVGDAKVQVYAAPATVFNAILGIIQTNSIDITDLESGHDITITKKGAGLTTKYEVNILIKSSKCKHIEDTSKLPDLSKAGKTIPAEKMVELLSSGPAANYNPSRALTAGSASVDTHSDVDDAVAELQAATKVASTAPKAAKPKADEDDLAAKLAAALKG